VIDHEILHMRIYRILSRDNLLVCGQYISTYLPTYLPTYLTYNIEYRTRTDSDTQALRKIKYRRLILIQVTTIKE
jgi:hypothetical protein